jgi:hypothetical protein
MLEAEVGPRHYDLNIPHQRRATCAAPLEKQMAEPLQL